MSANAAPTHDQIKDLAASSTIELGWADLLDSYTRAIAASRQLSLFDQFVVRDVVHASAISAAAATRQKSSSSELSRQMAGFAWEVNQDNHLQRAIESGRTLQKPAKWAYQYSGLSLLGALGLSGVSLSVFLGQVLADATAGLLAFLAVASGGVILLVLRVANETLLPALTSAWEGPAAAKRLLSAEIDRQELSFFHQLLGKRPPRRWKLLLAGPAECLLLGSLVIFVVVMLLAAYGQSSSG